MDKQQAKELLERYWAGQCTPEEEKLLDTAFSKIPRQNTQQYTEQEYNQWLAHTWQRLESRIPPTTRRIPLRRYAALAASLLLICAIGYYFYAAIDNPTDGIAPGGNKASLTLADGRTIDLSEAQSGIVVGDENITYQDGSLINLQHADATQPSRSKFGTGSNDSTLLALTTPRGGQYQITLPDGTSVWLNAGSTLRYPARFDDKERIVELEGEAYFEVSRQLSAGSRQPPAVGNKENQRSSAQSTSSVFHLPFLVKTKTQTVEVLGTHFNINAYNDGEVVKTTLIHGSVKVSLLAHSTVDQTAAHSTILKPGSEAINTDNRLEVRQADIAGATDWKNGLINFNDETLESIMNKIVRWYDVEVVYDGADTQMRFGGSVSRYAQVSEVLRRLELTGDVHFKINGRRIIVTN